MVPRPRRGPTRPQPQASSDNDDDGFGDMPELVEEGGAPYRGPLVSPGMAANGGGGHAATATATAPMAPAAAAADSGSPAAAAAAQDGHEDLPQLMDESSENSDDGHFSDGRFSSSEDDNYDYDDDDGDDDDDEDDEYEYDEDEDEDEDESEDEGDENKDDEAYDIFVAAPKQQRTEGAGSASGSRAGQPSIREVSDDDDEEEEEEDMPPLVDEDASDDDELTRPAKKPVVQPSPAHPPRRPGPAPAPTAAATAQPSKSAGTPLQRGFLNKSVKPAAAAATTKGTAATATAAPPPSRPVTTYSNAGVGVRVSLRPEGVPPVAGARSQAPAPAQGRPPERAAQPARRSTHLATPAPAPAPAPPPGSPPLVDEVLSDMPDLVSDEEDNNQQQAALSRMYRSYLRGGVTGASVGTPDATMLRPEEEPSVTSKTRKAAAKASSRQAEGKAEDRSKRGKGSKRPDKEAALANDDVMTRADFSNDVAWQQHQASERERLRRQMGLVEDLGPGAAADHTLGYCCLRPGNDTDHVCAEPQCRVRESHRHYQLQCTRGCNMLFHVKCWRPFADGVAQLRGDEFDRNFKANTKEGKPKLHRCLTDCCEGHITKVHILQGAEPPGAAIYKHELYNMDPAVRPLAAAAEAARRRKRPQGDMEAQAAGSSTTGQTASKKSRKGAAAAAAKTAAAAATGPGTSGVAAAVGGRRARAAAAAEERRRAEEAASAASEGEARGRGGQVAAAEAARPSAARGINIVMRAIPKEEPVVEEQLPYLPPDEVLRPLRRRMEEEGDETAAWPPGRAAPAGQEEDAAEATAYEAAPIAAADDDMVLEAIPAAPLITGKKKDKDKKKRFTTLHWDQLPDALGGGGGGGAAAGGSNTVAVAAATAAMGMTRHEDSLPDGGRYAAAAAAGTAAVASTAAAPPPISHFPSLEATAHLRKRGDGLSELTQPDYVLEALHHLKRSVNTGGCTRIVLLENVDLRYVRDREGDPAAFFRRELGEYGTVLQLVVFNDQTAVAAEMETDVMAWNIYATMPRKVLGQKRPIASFLEEFPTERVLARYVPVELDDDQLEPLEGTTAANLQADTQEEAIWLRPEDASMAICRALAAPPPPPPPPHPSRQMIAAAAPPPVLDPFSSATLAAAASAGAVGMMGTGVFLPASGAVGGAGPLPVSSPSKPPRAPTFAEVPAATLPPRGVPLSWSVASAPVNIPNIRKRLQIRDPETKQVIVLSGSGSAASSFNGTQDEVAAGAAAEGAAGSAHELTYANPAGEGASQNDVGAAVPAALSATADGGSAIGGSAIMAAEAVGDTAAGAGADGMAAAAASEAAGAAGAEAAEPRAGLAEAGASEEAAASGSTVEAASAVRQAGIPVQVVGATEGSAGTAVAAGAEAPAAAGAPGQGGAQSRSTAAKAAVDGSGSSLTPRGEATAATVPNDAEGALAAAELQAAPREEVEGDTAGAGIAGKAAFETDGARVSEPLGEQAADSVIAAPAEAEGPVDGGGSDVQHPAVPQEAAAAQQVALAPASVGDTAEAAAAVPAGGTPAAATPSTPQAPAPLAAADVAPTAAPAAAPAVSRTAAEASGQGLLPRIASADATARLEDDTKATRTAGVTTGAPLAPCPVAAMPPPAATLAAAVAEAGRGGSAATPAGPAFGGVFPPAVAAATADAAGLPTARNNGTGVRPATVSDLIAAGVQGARVLAAAAAGRDSGGGGGSSGSGGGVEATAVLSRAAPISPLVVGGAAPQVMQQAPQAPPSDSAWSEYDNVYIMKCNNRVLPTYLQNEAIKLATATFPHWTDRGSCPGRTALVLFNQETQELIGFWRSSAEDPDSITWSVVQHLPPMTRGAFQACPAGSLVVLPLPGNCVRLQQEGARMVMQTLLDNARQPFASFPAGGPPAPPPFSGNVVPMTAAVPSGPTPAATPIVPAFVGSVVPATAATVAANPIASAFAAAPIITGSAPTAPTVQSLVRMAAAAAPGAAGGAGLGPAPTGAPTPLVRAGAAQIRTPSPAVTPLVFLPGGGPVGAVAPPMVSSAPTAAAAVVPGGITAAAAPVHPPPPPPAGAPPPPHSYLPPFLRFQQQYRGGPPAAPPQPAAGAAGQPPAPAPQAPPPAVQPVVQLPPAAHTNAAAGTASVPAPAAAPRPAIPVVRPAAVMSPVRPFGAPLVGHPMVRPVVQPAQPIVRPFQPSHPGIHIALTHPPAPAVVPLASAGATLARPPPAPAARAFAQAPSPTPSAASAPSPSPTPAEPSADSSARSTLFCPLCQQRTGCWFLVSCKHMGPCEECCPGDEQVQVRYAKCVRCDKPVGEVIKARVS